MMRRRQVVAMKVVMDGGYGGWWGCVVYDVHPSTHWLAAHGCWHGSPLGSLPLSTSPSPWQPIIHLLPPLSSHPVINPGPWHHVAASDHSDASPRALSSRKEKPCFHPRAPFSTTAIATLLASSPCIMHHSHSHSQLHHASCIPHRSTS